MNAGSIKRALEAGLNDNDGARRYLGMSQISKCPLCLYHCMVNGPDEPDLKLRRFFHEGYLHERDLLERLRQIGVRVFGLQHQLIAPCDSRLRGHIDGELWDEASDSAILLEIKSVNENRFGRVVQFGHALDEHVAQVQLYMRYGGYGRAWVIYKQRDTGELWIVEMTRDDALGAQLERKALAVLAAVDAGVPPECTCGYCRY